MRIDSAFPSTYLKAADLQGRNVSVVMDHVKMEDIGGDHKPILYFRGKEKGLVLNKTNSNNISIAYGYETDEWTGKAIELFPTMVDFQGKSVEAIRCRPPRAGTNGNGNGHAQRSQHPYAPPQYETTAAAGGAGSDGDLDDSIPFISCALDHELLLRKKVIL